ncbi:MAG: hypothetical protein PHD82_17970, partial [Candidatus Riflebacteria bacterium]|nr:hypothetical protein [Candidatus Riflebacteria bacterium]
SETENPTRNPIIHGNIPAGASPYFYQQAMPGWQFSSGTCQKFCNGKPASFWQDRCLPDPRPPRERRGQV